MGMIHVMPLPDGVDQRRSWQVKAGGARVSTHTRKSAALARARREAGDGDTVQVHGTGGEIQREVAPRDDRGGRRRTAQRGSGLSVDLGGAITADVAGGVDGLGHSLSDTTVGEGPALSDEGVGFGLEGMVLDAGTERDALDKMGLDDDLLP